MLGFWVCSRFDLHGGLFCFYIYFQLEFEKYRMLVADKDSCPELEERFRPHLVWYGDVKYTVLNWWTPEVKLPAMDGRTISFFFFFLLFNP